MASKKNQPYLPLYVQDFLTDEKLNECSAATTGVYIKIMCVMHKSDPYGTILLKQKDKQSSEQIKNFAYKLLKFLPFEFNVVYDALIELIDEKVLTIDGDMLFQKRMVYDGKISESRSRAGRRGGLATQLASNFAQAKNETNEQAKPQANSENEVVIVVNNTTTNTTNTVNDNNLNIFNEDIFNYIEKNFGRSLSPIEIDKILSWQKDFEIDNSEESTNEALKMIKYAVDLSVFQNVKTFAYVDGILKNWKALNFKTYQQIKDAEDKRLNRTRNSASVTEVFDYDWLNDPGDDYEN